MDFLKQIQRITYVYDISNEQAACYLSNYEMGTFVINIITVAKILIYVERLPRTKGEQK